MRLDILEVLDVLDVLVVVLDEWDGEVCVPVLEDDVWRRGVVDDEEPLGDEVVRTALVAELKALDCTDELWIVGVGGAAILMEYEEHTLSPTEIAIAKSDASQALNKQFAIRFRGTLHWQPRSLGAQIAAANADTMHGDCL